MGIMIPSYIACFGLPLDLFQIEESQLSEVRHRIVKLLGSLGGAVNQALVSNKTEDIAKVAVAWDTTKHLKFDMPFMDIKPTIYFGKILFENCISQIRPMCLDYYYFFKSMNTK